MEKLDPKYVAQYLPYGLNCICHTNYNGGIDTKQKIVAVGETYITYTNTCYQSVDVQFSDILLILRPISDLTKEIDVNGEKFIPTERLFELYGGGYVSFKAFDNGFIYNLFLSDKKGFTYELYNLLISWHFDLDNLIENNLAIDINTL